jgi:hypothetical protein
VNLPFEFFLFCFVFFVLLTVVNTIQAHRKKEKAYYIGTMASFAMLLAIVFTFLSQFVLALIIIVVGGVFSLAGLPKILKARRQEITKQLQKEDLSASFRVRDFFTNIGGLKLAYRWGLKKYLFFVWLCTMLALGGLIYIMNYLWLGLQNIESIVTYTVGFSTFSTIISCVALKPNFEKRKNSLEVKAI